MEDITNKRLYLNCEECESAWIDPERSSNVDASFLSFNEDFEAKVADWKTIQHYGWDRYELKAVEK